MRKTLFKEEYKMAVWELAILLVGVTYLAVNIVGMFYVNYMLKIMKKFDGIIDKSVKFTEKMIDSTIQEMDDSE